MVSVNIRRTMADGACDGEWRRRSIVDGAFENGWSYTGIGAGLVRLGLELAQSWTKKTVSTARQDRSARRS
jgi:hypothetical protein